MGVLFLIVVAVSYFLYSCAGRNAANRITHNYLIWPED